MGPNEVRQGWTFPPIRWGGSSLPDSLRMGGMEKTPPPQTLQNGGDVDLIFFSRLRRAVLNDVFSTLERRRRKKSVSDIRNAIFLKEIDDL